MARIIGICLWNKHIIGRNDHGLKVFMVITKLIVNGLYSTTVLGKMSYGTKGPIVHRSVGQLTWGRETCGIKSPMVHESVGKLSGGKWSCCTFVHMEPKSLGQLSGG